MYKRRLSLTPSLLLALVLLLVCLPPKAPSARRLALPTTSIDAPAVGNLSGLPDSCSAEVQGNYLLVFFYFLGNGPWWLNQSGWREAFFLDIFPPCYTVASNGSQLELPSHCCFFGVGCCTQTTCPPNAPNPYNCNCTFGLVTNVTLDYNNGEQGCMCGSR